MRRLRSLMSGSPDVSVVRRRFKIGDLVEVHLKDDVKMGKIIRTRRGNTYVVETEGGDRCYVNGQELTDGGERQSTYA